MAKGFIENIHHGLQHSLDLIEKAHQLEEKLSLTGKVNWSILEAASYLHDMFAFRSVDHGEEAAAFFERNVENKGFSAEETAAISEAVILHDRKPSEGVNVRLETKLLYDADNLDAFGIKGVYRYFCAYIERGFYASRSKSEILNEIKKRVSDNAERRYRSLYFKESREMAGREFSLTKMFFDKLVEENYSSNDYKGATGVFAFVCEYIAEKPWDIFEKFTYHSSRQTRGSGEEEKFVEVYLKKLRDKYAGTREKWRLVSGFTEMVPDQRMQELIYLIENSG